jgi:23S rRNA pseudouridine955/2504/2580 synthase
VNAPAVFTVSAAEAGQKLVQYLARVLGTGLPGSVLMRWIRTGQVRVDGKRAKPFDRVEDGQAVRLPPFALAEALRSADTGRTPGDPLAGGHARPGAGETDGRASAANLADTAVSRRHAARSVPAPAPPLTVLAETPEYLAIAKPAGLPVHPGSGWSDSIQTRIGLAFAESAYVPQLAHRLDRDTSGVLLAARTHRALTAAHEAFRRGEAAKEYLCWVRGAWTLCGLDETVELTDLLAKAGPPGREKVAPASPTGKSQGKAARLAATPLRIEPARSLLRIRLFTGRTHQIRAQLSSRGHPIMGDAKYGGGRPPLYLHAWRLAIAGQSFECPPPWTGDFAAAPPSQ